MCKITLVNLVNKAFLNGKQKFYLFLICEVKFSIMRILLNELIIHTNGIRK